MNIRKQQRCHIARWLKKKVGGSCHSVCGYHYNRTTRLDGACVLEQALLDSAEHWA